LPTSILVPLATNTLPPSATAVIARPTNTAPALATATVPPLDVITVANAGRVDQLYVLEGHTDRVTGVAYSPDGQIIASGAHDGTVRLWRASDGALLRVIHCEGGGTFDSFRS
jgi:WD40 repeat protein